MKYSLNCKTFCEPEMTLNERVRYGWYVYSSSAMNGAAYSLDKDILIPSLTKTPFTIFLTDLDLKKKDKEKKTKFGEGRDAACFILGFCIAP